MAQGTSTVLPGTLSYREFSASQADALTRDQTRHLYAKGTSFGFLVGDTPTTKEVWIHTAKAAGVIRRFEAGMEDTGSSASSTFDLKAYAAGGSSGSSVLSAAITISNGDTDNTPETGTINTSSYVAGTQFYALMTVSSSTGAAGPWCEALFDELSP